MVRYTNARRIIYILTACIWAFPLVLLVSDAPGRPYVEDQSYPAIRLELVRTFQFNQPGHAALSPDGRKLAVRRNNMIEIWDVTSETLVRRIKGTGRTQPRRNTPVDGYSVYGQPPPSHVKWSPNGKLLAVGATDMLIRVVDVLTGRIEDSIRPPAPSAPSYGSDPVAAYPVGWSPNGRTLVVRVVAREKWYGGREPYLFSRTTYLNVDSRSKELTLLERDPGTATTMPRFYGEFQEGLPVPIAWSPNGTSFVSYRDEFSLACWDVHSGKTMHELSHKGAVLANWSANGRTVAYTNKGADYVRLADCKARRDKGTLPARVSSGSTPAVRGLAWSPDGRTLATYTVAGLTLWQKNGSMEDFIPEQPNSVSSAYTQQAQVEVTWSPNGQLIATSESFGHSRVTKVWDLLFGGPPQMLATTGAAQVMWSKDSSELHILYNGEVVTWGVVRDQ